MLGLDPFGYAQDSRHIQAKSGDLVVPPEQFRIHRRCVMNFQRIIG